MSITKKIGGIGRKLGRSAVALWRSLTPFINRLGRAFWRELGPIGIEIVKSAVSVAIQRGLKGEDGRAVALDEIKKGFEAAKIEARQRAINFALEVFFNQQAKTI